MLNMCCFMAQCKLKTRLAKWKNKIFCSNYQEKVREAVSWLAAQEKKLAKLLIDTENETYYQKYKVSCISSLTAFAKRNIKNSQRNIALHLHCLN